MREDVGPPPETYEAIMQATYRAFCEHGYADLTMRDIAEEFEKSRSLLHYHYDTKRELIVALLDYLVAMYVDMMEGERTDDPRADLERYVDEAVVGPDTDEFDFEDFHTALNELRTQAPRVPEYREQLDRSYTAIHESVAGTVRAGVEQGVFRDVDPEEYAAVVMDAADSARTRYLTLGHDPEAARDRIQRYLIDPLYVE